MKYICLGYYDKTMDTHPKAEIDAEMSKCGPYMEKLYKTGNVIVDVGLTADTASLRTRKGKLMVSDGPFVETKEQLGGVTIIEAENLDEAVRIMSMHPAARLGEQFGWGIEIRPLHTFEMPQKQSKM